MDHPFPLVLSLMIQITSQAEIRFIADVLKRKFNFSFTSVTCLELVRRHEDTNRHGEGTRTVMSAPGVPQLPIGSLES